MNRAVRTALATCMMIAASAFAAQPPQGGLVQGDGGARVRAPSPEMVVRTYNVADLVRETMDYPADNQLRPPTDLRPAPPVHTQGGELFGANPSKAQSTSQPVRGGSAIELGALATLITQTVDGWGSGAGRISTLGTMLVIRQTAENHAQIQELLNEVRRSAAPSQALTVRATWVRAPAGALAAPTTEVSAEWMAQQETYCESQLTCFSGQTVHISSGQGRLIAADVTPVVGTNSVAFDPTALPVLFGVTLQISPQLVPSGDSVILDVQTSVSEMGPPEPPITAVARSRRPEEQVGQDTATVDRMNGPAQEFKTTARVPLRKKVIVGGMTLDPAAAAQQQRQLYLVVEIDRVP